MVLSKIDKSVSYSEIKSIEEVDEEFNATMYIAEIHDQNCLIALGNLNKSFIKKEILYIPIYLVDDKKVIAKIGVFEFEKDNEPIIYDAERDFDLDKLGLPLLFGFVTKEYIIDKIKGLNIPELDEDPSYVDEQEKEDEDKSPKSKESLVFPFENDDEDLVDIEKQTEANSERENFDKSVAVNWMQKFMKNLNYEIQDVESNGDCFFAVLREAFEAIPLQVKVSELREILVDHFDKDSFDVRKERYEMFSKAYEKAKLEKKKASLEFSKKKKELLKIYKDNEVIGKDKSKDLTERKKASTLAVKAKNEWNKKFKPKLTIIKNKKDELFKLAEEDLKAYKIMDSVDTIEQFKEKIKTTEYWADEWAIKMLESLLNIKMIIFSREKFEEKELENVLQCGGELPEHIRKAGSFKPLYYVMTVHTGNHYKLLKYKDRRLFKFNEIPYDVKKLIKEKCMESDNSEWNYIPKFKALNSSRLKKKKEDKEEDDKEEEDKEEDDKEGDEDKEEEEKEDDKKEKKSKKKSKSKKKLYTDDVVFQFYSRSADAPKPGKGSGEKISDVRRADFKDLELKENKGWRKVLSNFYIAPIQIDGKQWNSVEHYYQASKFKKENPEYYFTFSLDDTTSKINKDPALAKSAGRKKQADEGFFKGPSSKEMKRAQLEKYKTNDYAREILLKTKDAKLMHYLGRGQGTVEFTETMEIRDELRKKGDDI